MTPSVRPLVLVCLALASPALSCARARTGRDVTMSYTMIPLGVRTDMSNVANFNSPICTFNGNTYAAFVRPDPADKGVYQTAVGKYDGEEWEFTTVEPNNFNDPWHAQPSLCVDRDGYVHVTYNMHSSFWQYSVSKRPEDISEWEFRGQALQGPHNEPSSSWHPGPGTADIPGNRITYQFMTTDRNGIPYVVYREALKTEPGVDYFQKQWSLGIAGYDLETRTWRRVGPDGGVFPFATEPGFRAQGGHVYFDAGNRMHVSWFWYAEYQRDGSGHKKPNYPCYAYSDDGGETFQNADGAPLKLPVDMAQSDVVVDPSWCEPNTEGYFNGYTQVCAMPDGTPIVHVDPRDPPPGKRRAIVIYDRTRGWGDPIPMPYSATRLVVDSEGVITAISSGLRVHRSYDRGRTWTTWDVDTGGGRFVTWPDYSYTPQSNQLRLLAQPGAGGDLHVYTIRFSDAPIAATDREGP